MMNGDNADIHVKNKKKEFKTTILDSYGKLPHSSNR